MKVYAAALLAVASTATANPQRARKGEVRQSAPLRRLQEDKDGPVDEMSMSLSMSVQPMETAIPCPLILKPVCCDGVTYDNDCNAEAAGATGCTEGACGTDESAPAVACPLIFAPVCCDLVTYDNDCTAEAAGATECTEGPCPPPVACPLNIAPVCGCDSVTYDNDCLAEAAGTTVCSEGKCEEPSGIACSTIYAPVCCDGETYSNTCESDAAGATDCIGGECEGTACPKSYEPVW